MTVLCRKPCSSSLLFASINYPHWSNIVIRFSSSDQYYSDASFCTPWPGREERGQLSGSFLSGSARFRLRLRTQHQEFKCSNCDKSFAYSDTLVRHKHKCLGLRHLQCVKCDYVCHRRYRLKVHMSRAHGIELVD